MKLTGYDEADKRRIVNLASRFVAGRIASGEIPCSDEAIKEAMPQAVEDARLILNAVNEYLCG